MKVKEKHKQQLINEIIIYFYQYSRPKRLKQKLDKLSYRKVKGISKNLGIYQKYYDDTPSEAELSIPWI